MTRFAGFLCGTTAIMILHKLDVLVSCESKIEKLVTQENNKKKTAETVQPELQLADGIGIRPQNCVDRCRSPTIKRITARFNKIRTMRTFVR